MPDESGRLFAEDIAARIGITVGDWRARVSRGVGGAPKPADRVLHAGAIRSVWTPSAIDEYVKARETRLGEAAVREIAREEIERHDHEEGR